MIFRLGNVGTRRWEIKIADGLGELGRSGRKNMIDRSVDRFYFDFYYSRARRCVLSAMTRRRASGDLGTHSVRKLSGHRVGKRFSDHYYSSALTFRRCPNVCTCGLVARDAIAFKERTNGISQRLTYARTIYYRLDAEPFFFNSTESKKKKKSNFFFSPKTKLAFYTNVQRNCVLRKSGRIISNNVETIRSSDFMYFHKMSF